MRGIKTLLAVAVIAGAGAAHAATIASFTVTESGNSTYGAIPISSQSLTGIADLDSSGVLTITLSGLIDASGVGYGTANISTVNQFTGSIAAGVFTPASAQSKTTSCTNNGSGTICGLVTLNTLVPLTSFGGTISLSGGGTLTGTISSTGSNGVVSKLTSTDVLTPVSSVPVPATAWLFGSGLLGLAGVTRRRSK